MISKFEAAIPAFSGADVAATKNITAHEARKHLFALEHDRHGHAVCFQCRSIRELAQFLLDERMEYGRPSRSPRIFMRLLR
jgi:hypothetical protein